MKVRREQFLKFIPQPPRCAARRLQDAGSTTRKRIGFAEEFLFTGAMVPSMLQYAGSPFAAAFHRGALSVTADTGSPIEATGILVPSFCAVQSASAMIVCAASAGNLEPAAGMACF